jgi:stearoyl-CoA desaturase (delta-9 desaturase)
MSAIFKRAPDERVEWLKSIPFFLMHLMPLFALFTGVRLFDVILCIVLYVGRMFFISAGYHRYFSHRSYKLGRIPQFIMAFGGTTCAQKGPLWWAGHHRNHHAFSDTERDIHSPKRGFWWSHVGWILCDKFKATPEDRIRDFTKYPELVWLDKHCLVPPTLLAITVLLLWGPSALFIGFFLSTILLYHITFCINSLAHVFGVRRYATTDTSRNSLILALMTLGEGWHNNHHHYRSSANQGFYWWEIDISYYVLRLLNLFGLVEDPHTPPKVILGKNRVKDGVFDVGMFEARIAAAVQALEKAKAQGGAYYEGKRQELETFIAEARRAAAEFSRAGSIDKIGAS